MDGGDSLRVRTPSAGDGGYGLQPEVHAAVARYAEAVTGLVESCSAAELPARVLAPFETLLAREELLAEPHRQGAAATYRRHVLYADPRGRFTVLALVWQPGQRTRIHGHSAWGVVGVYEGHPNVCRYDCEGGNAASAAPRMRSDRRFGPGDTCTVQPGLVDTHCIYNGTNEPVITLHTYGRDLVAAPDSINIELPEPA